MSIKLMSGVWELKLPASEKLVLLAYADHADDEGFCFPSIGRVAWKTDYSRRAVQRIVRRLEERGLLEVSTEATGRPGVPTEYRLHVDAGFRKEPFQPRIPRGDRQSPVSPKGATLSTKTGDPGDATGDPESLEGRPRDARTISEPSVETSKNLAQVLKKFGPNPKTIEDENGLWVYSGAQWILVEETPQRREAV